MAANYLFHHLFLPRKLPCGDEALDDMCLPDFVLESLEAFSTQTVSGYSNRAAEALSLMQLLRNSLTQNFCLTEEGIRHSLQQVLVGESASLYIKAQNAAMLVRSASNDKIKFEMFELSPTNESVYNTEGRLVRNFPATVISVDRAIFSDANFQSMFATTIAKMSAQSVAETKRKVKKAHQLHDETRDTTNPTIVTELLSSMLRGFGELVDVRGIQKHTREEVIWKDSLLPWRRSPLWLLIRVSLQLTMDCANNEPSAYKPFMAFLMSRALQEAMESYHDSEILSTMLAKVCTRLKKLGNPQNGQWLTTIHDTVSQASRCLEERWHGIQSRRETMHDPDILARVDPAYDARHKLRPLNKFISSIHHRKKPREPTDFHPHEPFVSYSSHELPSISHDCDISRMLLQLAAIEDWVANNLETWQQRYSMQDSACSELSKLITNYHNTAVEKYMENPERMSRMYLTILELWIAIDKTTVHAIPSLRSYSPEIPIVVYQDLVLGSCSEMKRLNAAEKYLHERSLETIEQSIFRSYGHCDSFQVSYVVQSAQHLQLLDNINEYAAAEKREKENEFHIRRGEYHHLMNQRNRLTCEQEVVWEQGMQVLTHSSECCRCELTERAASMTIEIFEWPLPSDPGQAKAVIFELDTPSKFHLWRDITLFLIHDVIQSTCQPSNTPVAHFPLATYHGLEGYQEQTHFAQRVCLSSEVKSHYVTHRATRRVSDLSSVSNVCLDNGLQFQYYDNYQRRFLNRYENSTKLAEDCRYDSLSGQELANFLQRDYQSPNGTDPNKVIASQLKYTGTMRSIEYKALATLPYGYKLGWMNLLRQMAMPEVNFNTVSCASFVLQVILQSGPNPERCTHRCPHSILLDSYFVQQMVIRLRDMISRVEKNWELYTALWVFACISVRLLSMAPLEMKEQLLDLVKRCREVTYQWMLQNKGRLDDLTEENQRTDFQKTLLDISLACSNTFYVEKEHLHEILLDSSQSTILLEASLLICNSSQLLLNQATTGLQRVMHDRWVQVMHRSGSMIAENVCNGDKCLDMAIRKNWPAFAPGSDWKILSGRAFCWLETSFEELGVHFNFWTAELLVNGVTVSRLPAEYLRDSTYQQLFGSCILDIVPSHLPGLNFCVARAVKGYTVHFGFQIQKGLLVRFENGASVFDLVPRWCLEGKLPCSFVEDYVHLYCHETGQVEFRQLEFAWTSNPNNWTLTRVNQWWELQASERRLVSSLSKTSDCIAALLRPLDSKLHLNIILDESTETLSVQVPRLRLDFFLRRGQRTLMSSQFRGMHISPDQSLGTLIGFHSRLVLRNLEDKKVLIPDGTVEFKSLYEGSPKRHVSVSITYGSAHRVRVFAVDNMFGCLRDDGLLESKLFLAYLHALTTYCVADPFTWRTGTEQALGILHSAAVRNPSYVNEGALKSLKAIASLSPNRSFYPLYMKEMQSVEWSHRLSFLAQDGRYYTSVKRILD